MDNWIPPDLHGFYIQVVFDSLEVLNGFLKQVVVSRRDIGINKWVNWLREDLSSRPHAWLRPDFVPPSPFSLSRILRLGRLGFWLNLNLLMPSFVKLGCFFSVGRVILLLLRISSWTLLVISCLRSLFWIFRGLLVGTCRRWLVLKSLLLVGWMGGLGMRLKLFPCLGSLVLLFFWSLVETTGTRPQGLLDAYVALFPKADGDSTPLGQRPLSVLPVVYRLWASLRLGHLREWVERWLPK